MESDRGTDRMSAMPLLKMNDKQADNSQNMDPSWSDQELEDFSQDPLEGVLRSVLHRPRAISRTQCVVSATFFSAVNLILGFLLAYLVFFELFPPLCGPNSKLHHKLSEQAVHSKIVEEVNPRNIRNVLLNLTDKPHPGGSQQSLVLANYLRDVWLHNGVPQVKVVPYNVLLSYPDEVTPNTILVTDISVDNVRVNISGEQLAFSSPRGNDPVMVKIYSAYSRSGKESGDPVYVNFGQPEDYKWLQDHGVDIRGKIFIARYGNHFRGDTVRLAEEFGATGIILFSDPHEYAPKGRNFVYPKAFGLPGTGTQSGTIMLGNGDPTTPGYPSVAGSYRLNSSEVPLPKILVQPIGYDDAEKILKLMTGIESPSSWKGDLNVSYKIGPGFTDPLLKLTMMIRNRLQMANVYNVIGTIPGYEEPDRYVLLGNHRDAWIFGGIDPNAGTAVMTELTRVLGQLYKTGWKPRRTIMFCSWGAEEQGLIGSTEWVEDNAKVLSERAVAYLNVDVAVEGNYTFRSLSTPILSTALYEAAKQIPNPNPAEVAQGREFVYDTWLYTSADESRPVIEALGSGSDFTSFAFLIGVPACDLMYKADKKAFPVGNPLYHSVYETFYAVDELLDPGFKYHLAITQLWGKTALSLADAMLLPFNISAYAKRLQDELKTFKKHFTNVLLEHHISLEYFEEAIQHFENVSVAFHASLASKNLDDSLTLRMANDQMMQVERAFIIPEGLPLAPHYKHVLMSPSSTDGYAGQFFPGLVDLLTKIESTADHHELMPLFRQHLAAVTYYIHSAASILDQH